MSTVSEYRETLSALQLIDVWAEVFSRKPLSTPSALSSHQKPLSLGENTIPPPTLVRDPEFLRNLQRHYRRLLEYPMDLPLRTEQATPKPSLRAMKSSLFIERYQLASMATQIEKSEHDTNDYHKKLLEPLVKLARVCMAEGGSSMTNLTANEVDDRLQHLHPKLVSQLAHKESGSENPSIPDHTILNDDGEVNLM